MEGLDIHKSDDKWELIKGGFYVKEDKSGRYKYSLEITGSSGRQNNSHNYVLLVFNPPLTRLFNWYDMSTHINRTAKYLIDITLRTGQNNLGQNNAFENALKSRNIGRVDGFKIVNLYSEVQTDPKDVNVNDEMSMVERLVQRS